MLRTTKKQLTLLIKSLVKQKKYVVQYNKLANKRIKKNLQRYKAKNIQIDIDYEAGL